MIGLLILMDMILNLESKDEHPLDHLSDQFRMLIRRSAGVNLPFSPFPVIGSRAGASEFPASYFGIDI